MSDEKKNGTERLLTLTLGDEFFAMDIYAVREILDMTDITRIPQTPDYMAGVVNVRGTAVPVIDLRLKFGMEPAERTLNTRIVIVEIRHGESVSAIGAIADSVREVLELESARIDPPPRMGAAVSTDFLKGIGKHEGRFILTLDMDKVFSSDEIIDLAKARQELGQADAA